MCQVAAAKFKAQSLALVEEVGPEGIVIMKWGRPVAKLIPLATDSASLIGSIVGKIN